MLVQALLNMGALLMLTDTLETWDLGPVHFFFPFLLGLEVVTVMFSLIVCPFGWQLFPFRVQR
jgi:hypothetical protein